jgi:hypothetical protein
MNIYEKLSAVQQELKAPKDKKNTFANYTYRSAEGILEAVKPILKKYGLTLLLSDEIQQIGERTYVKATAWAIDPAGQENLKISVTAYAREAETKKGLDDSQITGTASSYARKYALNGLLLIDDTKDADTDEYQKETHPEKITADQKKIILALADQANIDLGKVLGGEDLGKMSALRANQLIAALKEKANGSKG